MGNITLPPLRDEYEPTRATLHAYARAVAVIPRAHGIAHPKWWHLSLEVRPEGLVTDPVPLPDGGAISLAIEIPRHRIVVATSAGAERTFSLGSGATGTEMSDGLIAAAAEHGLEGGYERARIDDDEPRRYDPSAAEAYFGAFVAVRNMFERHRATLGERTGPIQLWPHNFDLAFETFGSRMVDGEDGRAPAQLSLGFYPAGDPYFYSNPWPFDESLTDIPLPHGATWHTEQWQGTLLPYSVVREAPDPAERLSEYARAVLEASAAGLGMEGGRE